MAGRQLPREFNSTPINRTPFGTIAMDNRNLEELWKNPQWTGKHHDLSNLIHSARLNGKNNELQE
jgi:hypothetical protein